MLNVISLGAGVQSTTMALMAAHGEIEPMPDCAIFADTGWEPQAVYDHLDWLCSPNVLPFPVHRVNNGNIREMLISEERGRYAAVPFFLGNGGMSRRQCTHEFKLKPLSWELRRLLGKSRRARITAGSVIVWIGISVDEAHRMKPSGVQWQTNRWPLIELRMSRYDCYAWLKRFDYPRPPKSACIGCPYKTNERWRETRNKAPQEWQDAVYVDEQIRKTGTLHNIKNAQYMHAQRVPLAEADLGADDRQADLFGNECEGMCGV